MNEVMLGAIINGVLVPFMGIVLIPRALREPETGRYLGFRTSRLVPFALIIACAEMLLIVPRFGVSFEMIYRLVFVTTFPFIISIVLIKVCDKFNFNIDYQVRKSDQKF